MADRLSLSSPWVCEHGPLPSGAGALSALLHDEVPAGRYGPNTMAVIDFFRLEVMSATETEAQDVAAWIRNDNGATLAEGFEAELISVATSAGLDDAARHAYADGMVVASESVDLGMTAQDVFFAHRPEGFVAAYGVAVGLAATAVALEQVLSSETTAAIRRPWTRDVVSQADTDALTGLLNHGAFERHLNEHLRRGPTEILAVLLLDLDRFKAFNDTLGHPAGDDLLVRIAGAIRRSLRDSDRAYRYGGDEFTILLHGADADVARVIADRITAAVAALSVDAPVHVTASVGFSCWPDDGSSA